MTHKTKRVRVEEYAYFVNKLHQKDNTKWRACRPGILEAMFPSEKHEFSVGQLSAQQGGLVLCTTGMGQCSA